MTVYILITIYLVCLYIAYRGATSADYKENIGDDLDDSEDFYNY